MTRRKSAKEITPSNVWSAGITIHPERLSQTDKISNDYFDVFLPYKVEKFGRVIDEDSLLLELINEDSVYIRGEKASEEISSGSTISKSKAVRKLRTQGSNRPRIRIPPMWHEHLIEHSGEESLIVELNETTDKPHIRIYKEEDYMNRISELNEQGANAVTATERIIAPIGTATAIIQFIENDLLSAESLSLEAPSKAKSNEDVTFQVTANLPLLEEVIVQAKSPENSFWTDIADVQEVSEQTSELELEYRFDAENPANLDSTGVFELRARIKYGDEYLNSETQKITVTEPGILDKVSSLF